MRQRFNTCNKKGTVKRIRKLKDSGYTTEEIAYATGLSQTSIRDLSRGGVHEGVRVETRDVIYSFYEQQKAQGKIEETPSEIINHFVEDEDSSIYKIADESLEDDKSIDHLDYDYNDFLRDTVINNQIRILNELKDGVDVLRTVFFISMLSTMIIIILIIINFFI